MRAFENLRELLQVELPGFGGLTMGSGSSSRPRDERRFRDELERLARRLRRRNRFVGAMLFGWFCVLFAVVAVSADPLKSVLAIGAMGAGTPWCIREMRALNREIFAIELLLAAVAKPDADLGELARYCAAILSGVANVPKQDAPQPRTA